MEELLKKINHIFITEREKNLRRFGYEYISFDEKSSTWSPYESAGYLDNIRQLPYDFFMTIEQCRPFSDSGYYLSTYSPCPLLPFQKTYNLEIYQEEEQMHRHDYYEIIYVCQGHRTMQIENETLTFQKGDICIFDTKCAHMDIRSQSEGVAFYCCVSPKIVDSYFISHLTEQRIRSFFLIQGDTKNEISYLKLHTNADTAALVEKYLAFIAEEMESVNTGYERIAQIYILRVLNEFHVSDEVDVHVLSKRLRGSKLFQAIARYISSNIADISLEKLTNQFHYQRDYYSRLIQKNTGMTYAEYVRTLRLDKAKNLLSNTDCSINEIMEYLGYQSHSYFYKIFHENTGMTPSEYRKKELLIANSN